MIRTCSIWLLRFGGARAVCLAVTLALVAPGAAFAQESALGSDDGAGETSPYEGRPIRELLVLAPGETGDGLGVPLTPELEQMVRNNLRTGLIYNESTIQSDVRRITRLGRFGKVQSLVQLQDDGSVIVAFVCEEQPIVRDVQFAGNKLIDDGTLRSEVAGRGLIIDTPVDPVRNSGSARAIEEMYRERGYYNVRVTMDEQLLEESGIVLFTILEGTRLKVSDIRFEGNRAFSDAELRGRIKTRESALLRRGPLDETTIRRDINALMQFYRDRGYLDVDVDDHVLTSPNNREAIVTFHIEEGSLYTIRNIRLDQADRDSSPSVFTSEQIAGLMAIKAGDVYSATDVQKSREAVRTAYGELGYVDIRVEIRESRDSEKPLVDLVVQVRQGQSFLTGELIIAGNHLTRHEVILRQLRLRSDRPLSLSDLEDSRKRLADTNLFDPRDPVRITIQSPDPDDPEYRDVLVEVKETNTGSFNFGGAVSSDSGLIGTLSVTQRNFDITDTPDSLGEFFSGRAFRGGGQTFSLNIQPGTQVENYSVSLSEPYLFDTDVSLGGSLFYRTRDYSEFDEQRYGGSISAGRRFGSRWVGTSQLRIESVELSNIEPSRPVDVFEVADENILVGLGFELTRNTTDDRIRPTRGTRLSLGVEQVGNDFSFTKLRATHDLFLSVYEDFVGRNTVVSFKTHVNYIPQDSDDVPLYERYYLGGRSFRGFDFRGISPRGIRNDTGEQGNDPVGGTWSFFWGAELTQPILEENVSGVLFLDTGTVADEATFEDYRVSIGTGLRIFVPGLSPVPLAFDFGFPIVRQPEDDERVFTFTLDLPF